MSDLKNALPETIATSVSSPVVPLAESPSESCVGADTSIAPVTEVRPIPLDQLEEFKFHAFKTYTGERLEQLTESIRANGVINAVIVRPKGNDESFEIISGHNRVKAAEAAGLSSVPTIVRDLTDDEAIILANESNIVQRDFMSWLPSERVKSIFQYHAAIKRQGSKTLDSSGGIRQKGEYAREKTARVYGIKPNVVRLHLDLHRLVPELMKRIDDGEFGVSAAQNISSVHKEVQQIVDVVLDEEKELKKYTVTVANSKEIKDEFLACDPADLRGERKTEIRKIVRNLLDDSLLIPEVTATSIEIAFPIVEYKILFGSASTDEAVDTIIEAVKYYQNADSTIDPPDGDDTLMDI